MSLSGLDLSYNRLSGSLPATWGSSRSALSSINAIAISGNNISGEVPPVWGHMLNLRYL